MKADFYMSNMGRYLFWIWLGLGGYCTVCSKPEKEEKDCVITSDERRDSLVYIKEIWSKRLAEYTDLYNIPR